MKLKTALNLAKKSLKTHKDEALFILCEYLQKDRAFIALNGDFDFDEKPYFKLIERFASGEPFEYIFEKAQFYGLEFKVQKGVLIPRFDTEILLELALKELSQKNYTNILEIGFGSGILSIILALKLALKIKACDISELALKLAKENALRHEVGHLIDFRLCDFKNFEGEVDFIISNPPYIQNDYKLDIWVQNEPKQALFGGVKGYEFLEELIVFARKNKVKALACEFGYDQKEILHKILHKNGFKAQFFKDFAGFDRAFLAHAVETI
ncbi:peptide chain release factor N(5)-glutamine methyltransferase [Campylobacter sp. MIT 12-8780]|uniref:HemK/PrmC family methyltransferase n=1 Tax=Campylobacter sp. MIT 12-8780 TaxID=2202200 RepID=UPI00115D30A6|nr:HemK/PrmC family methyltransferase [Campylobacter sp. MIT 12-8780]TQR41903.1 peptide chain release factor N(5)-glutamine methyltransferase [Campylobacter sp. MIT 12-8780]